MKVRAWRVVARALLDGYPVADIMQTGFPNVTRFVESLQTGREEIEARKVAANVIAFELGWRLFGPFVQAATGLAEASDSTIRESVESGVARIIAP